MSTSSELSTAFQSLKQDVHQRLGFTPELEKNLTTQSRSASLLGGTISTTINVPITNGQGTMTSDQFTSWWVTLSGTGTITAPTGGTWSLTVTDLVASKVVFSGSGLQAGQQIPFTYKTGLHVQLQAQAVWSQGGNTTLQLQINASY